MASIPVDLATYLYIHASTSETSGVDLFEGPPPEKPENIVVLTNYIGEPALDRVMGPSLTPPGVEVTLVQLFVRNTDMAMAKTIADAYHVLLDNFNGILSGRTYFQVESVTGMPFSIGQDKQELWRYVGNYRVQHSR